MFIDHSSRVDREGLRLYVIQELINYKQQAIAICTDKRKFWNAVKTHAKTLVSEEQIKAISVVNQIEHLPYFIQSWMDTALDSAERFDFFVLTKAHELKSGDQQNDYYWALQIRHDQLIALVRVLEILLDKLKLWITIRPNLIFADPMFSGLTTYGIEDQVYLEAKKVYQERLNYIKQK